MDNNWLLRSYNSEIKATLNSEKQGIIEGYAIVYDSEANLGPFREIIVSGALKNTNLKDVRFLVNHDKRGVPLARSRNNNENSTMQLIVDDKGLKFKVKLDLENNAEARNLYSAIERRDVTGVSFMFSVRGEQWEDENTSSPLRKVTDIESIIELSAVTFPAYEATEINARCKAELDNYRSTLDNAQKNNTLDNVTSIDDIELLKLKNENEFIGGKNYE